MLAVPGTRLAITVPLALPRYQFSAKLQKRQRRRPRSNRTDEIGLGDMGVAVLKSVPHHNKAAIEAQTLPHKSESHGGWSRELEDYSNKEISIENGEGRGRGSSLSGLDVLLALQSATAQKKGSSRGRKRDLNTNKGKGKGSNGGEDLVDEGDDARPITIRSDWTARLDEMERLLEELKRREV